MACSEGVPKGLVRRRVERGFWGDDLRAGFRDRWHFPKDGPAGVSAEASKGGIRQGFGLVPEGLIGRASGTHVKLRKDSEGGVVRAGRFEKASGGGFEGWSSGMTFIVGLGTNGWDFS